LSEKRGIKKREEISDDFLQPVWFGLPARFYARLNRVAKAHNVTRAEVLTRGIELFAQEMKRSDTRDLIPTGAQPGVLNEVMGKVAARRWERLTPEERSAYARKIALARWGKKKKPGSTAK
jgi:hypothetical protein